MTGASIAPVRQLCAAMPAKGIVVDLVGFDVGSNATPVDVLDAFQVVAQQIADRRRKN